MDSRENRSRAIQAEIRRVLLQAWDPIGIRDNSGQADEYDTYVGGVYRLVASGASAEEIAAHLVRVEREQMGFDQARPVDLLVVGRALAALDVRLEQSLG